MRWFTKKRIREFTISILILFISSVSTTDLAYAFPTNHWELQPKEHLEVLRDYACFGEGRAGERTTSKIISFNRNVLSAEVFVSGFNMWYTRQEHDHEVMRKRVDAFIDKIGREAEPGEEIFIGPQKVVVKLIYAMMDEDTGDSDDYNDACIGFTVLARTQ